MMWVLTGAGLVFMLLLTAVRAGQFFAQRSAHQWLGEKWLTEIREERNKAEARAAGLELERNKSEAQAVSLELECGNWRRQAEQATARAEAAEQERDEVRAQLARRSRWVT